MFVNLVDPNSQSGNQRADTIEQVFRTGCVITKGLIICKLRLKAMKKKEPYLLRSARSFLSFPAASQWTTSKLGNLYLGGSLRRLSSSNILKYFNSTKMKKWIHNKNKNEIYLKIVIFFHNVLIGPELELNVERMKKISTKDNRVDWSVDSMDPACWDEHSLSLLQHQLVTPVKKVKCQCPWHWLASCHQSCALIGWHSRA